MPAPENEETASLMMPSTSSTRILSSAFSSPPTTYSTQRSGPAAVPAPPAAAAVAMIPKNRITLRNAERKNRTANTTAKIVEAPPRRSGTGYGAW
jgi:hypothetical protein